MAWITSKRVAFMVHVVIHAGVINNREVINIFRYVVKLLIKQINKTRGLRKLYNLS